MKVDCFRITDKLTLETFELESVFAEKNRTKESFWINIRNFETNELEGMLDKLKVTNLARRLCLEANDRPGFYPMSEMIFLVMPVLTTKNDIHREEYAAILIRDNLMLTIRNDKESRLQNTISFEESTDWLPEPSVIGLLSSIMIVLSLESLHLTSHLRDQIIDLDERIEKQASSVTSEEISDKRKGLLTLESVISGQLPILEAIISNEKISGKSATVQEYLICALSNLKATDRSLPWLEGRIDVIRSVKEMYAQDKMNRRLERLTIVSLIFMPMTFLAGIWGMNFELMPELNFPFGYPMALGSMFLLGTGMYFFFRKKGWFEK